MYTRQQSVVTRLVSWHKILASQRALQRRPRPHLQNKTRRILFQNPSQRHKKGIDAYIKFLKSKEGQEPVAFSQAAADAGNPVKTQVPVEEGGKPSDILHWNLNKVVVENGKDTCRTTIDLLDNKGFIANGPGYKLLLLDLQEFEVSLMTFILEFLVQFTLYHN